jgi:DUF2971 family protein
MLSHYTREAGMVGIVRSQTIWATNFAAMEDNKEFVYALTALYEGALESALDQLPADLVEAKREQLDLSNCVEQMIATVRKGAEGSDGYGELYVACFARASHPDEEKDGILTLWREYAKLTGYCLEFDQAEVESVVRHERTRYTYARIELAPVAYELDRATDEYRYLATQLGLRILDSACRQSNDRRFAPDFTQLSPDSVFASRLLGYCAKHNNPSFRDEREVRIFAYPVDAAARQFYTGLSVPKRIYERGT